MPNPAERWVPAPVGLRTYRGGSNEAVQRTAGGNLHQQAAVIYRGTTSHTRARRQPPVDLVLVDSPAGPETPSLWSDSVRATARNRASQ
jgi:hypothetical protein